MDKHKIKHPEQRQGGILFAGHLTVLATETDNKHLKLGSLVYNVLVSLCVKSAMHRPGDVCSYASYLVNGIIVLGPLQKGRTIHVGMHIWLCML